MSPQNPTGRLIDEALLGLAPPHRADGLFVVRESDEHDLIVFDSMRNQTYLKFRHKPEVEAIRKAGLAPFKCEPFQVEFELPDGGGTIVETVTPTVVQVGRTRTILFYYRGYWHLWAMSSAAKQQHRRFNDFTRVLIELIEAIRPIELYAAHVSRLVRSLEQGTRLQASFFGNVDTVCLDGDRLPFSGTGSDFGQIMFTMLAQSAAKDRDGIVQRTLAGRVAAWRREKWCQGPLAVPFAYHLGPGGLPLPEPERRDTVREMLIILSEADTPAEELVRRLSAVGVTSKREDDKTGKSIPLSELTNAWMAIHSLYASAAAWVQGEHLVRYQLAVPHMDELAGLEVARYDESDDFGEVQMLYRFDVPDGGWAEPDVLTAFRAAVARRTEKRLAAGATAPRPLCQGFKAQSVDAEFHATVLRSSVAAMADGLRDRQLAGSRAKKTVAPFAGWTWRNDGWITELQVKRNTAYELVRWPERTKVDQ